MIMDHAAKMAALADEIITEVIAEQAADQATLDALRRLPAERGPCPAAGLPAMSAGGYSIVVCPLCWAPLGPWRWSDPVSGGWPRTTEHTRQIPTV